MEISKNQKIGIGIAGLIVLYFLFKNPYNGGEVYDPTGNGGTIDNNGISFNAKAVADGLHDAMNGPGTDEEEIQNLLRTVSASQFALVFKAFGKRDKGIFTTDLKDLKYWLKDEISSVEYNTLRLKYPIQL